MNLKNITFSYDNTKIFENYSLEIPTQGIVAISAPSGRGKTTLLKLMAGLLTPDAGEIEGPSLKEIAFMFQENRLLKGLDAKGQIEVVLEKGEDPFLWLKVVGLEEAAGKKPDELSGGMQRRISLARCLAFGKNKKLIILDEPFTGVDYQCAKDIMDEIKKMGIQVVLSTHDEKILTLCDNVIQL